MEWGREEEKEKVKAGVIEVQSGVRLKDGSRGRIICFKADVGGKIGSKVLVPCRNACRD
jgi:N-acetyltransferase